MPKRTNDFQSLMYLIQSQLAPTGAEVKESVFLTDEATSSDREIDIFISDPTGGLPPQTIAIKCRDTNRKPSIQWIDEIIGKYFKIPVRRVVAISRSGFTQNALKKAKDAGIDTLTLGEALEADWETAVKNVIAAILQSHLVRRMRTELRFNDLSKPVLLRKQPKLLSATIIRPDDSPLMSVENLVAWMFQGPQMQDVLANHANQLTEQEPYLFAELTYDFPAGFYLVAGRGPPRNLREVMVYTRCQREVIRIELEQKSLGNARVAFGAADTFVTAFTLLHHRCPKVP